MSSQNCFVIFCQAVPYFLKVVLVQVDASQIHCFFSINNDESLNASTLHKHICTQSGEENKRGRKCDLEFLGFALFASVYWVLNTYDKHSLIICVCGFSRVPGAPCSYRIWSYLISANTRVWPHSRQPVIQRAIITVFWLSLCASMHHC